MISRWFCTLNDKVRGAARRPDSAGSGKKLIAPRTGGLSEENHDPAFTGSGYVTLLAADHMLLYGGCTDMTAIQKPVLVGANDVACRRSQHLIRRCGVLMPEFRNAVETGLHISAKVVTHIFFKGKIA